LYRRLLDGCNLAVEVTILCMKRVVWWVLNAIAAISLILAVWFGVAWAGRLLPRRFWIKVDLSMVDTPLHKIGVYGAGNDVIFQNLEILPQPVVGPDLQDQMACERFIKQYRDHRGASLAVRWSSSPHFGKSKQGTCDYAGTLDELVVGLGYFPAIFMLLPAFLWTAPLIRSIRRKLTGTPGFCRRCGYDLRATPERCPECGTKATPE